MNKPTYKRLYELLRSLHNEGYELVSTSELIHLYRKLDPAVDNDSVANELSTLQEMGLLKFIRRSGNSEGAYCLLKQNLEVSVK